MTVLGSFMAFSVQAWQFELAALLLLYAEIHYHFKIAPSWLYRREPEIVADAPHRLDPLHPLPILVLIKDAHSFPIELLRIVAEISSSCVMRVQLHHTTERITKPWWWRVFHLRLPEEMRGAIKVNVALEYRCRGKIRRCYNDNYRGTSHAPFEVFAAETPLPTLPGFYHGDLHCHTNATSDQVEYGAPLHAMVDLAKAQGIAFLAATDHSYDLDDFYEDYLHNDPALRKWHDLQNEIRQLNARHRDFVIIPGEEVSCGNAQGENVHFLVLNHPPFISGRGDGGEKWGQTKPDHTIAEVLDMLTSQALAFAAHPSVPVPILERLLLRRGTWALADFAHARLHGLQFWNGKDLGEEEGFERWRKLLLEGRKFFAIAGNDAHGSFNRYRQIAWPCLSIAENHDHLFGRQRTVVKLLEELALEPLLAALRGGRAIITTGPVLDLVVEHKPGAFAHIGETICESATHAVLAACSSPEFGRLERISLWQGDLVDRREEELFVCTRFSQPYEFRVRLPLSPRPNPYYVRAQVTSVQPARFSYAGKRMVGMSNPIWIAQNSRSR